MRCQLIHYVYVLLYVLLHQSVEVMKHSICDLVVNGSRYTRVVCSLIVQQFGTPFTEMHRQPFVISDMLNLRDHSTPCFLIQFLVCPIRVCWLECTCDAIVLAKPNRMKSCQLWMLIDSIISYIVRVLL